ncbi:dTDP-4-dehydrorhamnose reductase [Vibrio ishigakensis]|uniref:dTDP-4-dehydrorhamnose reductase n=1 Tax=Vibrio ishigakensis TaxID=1481914 RepID=A0A0B8PHC4_9VIBR|nr:dTDP-4-dehydrorhamnose reductase [Vibrio ishigakensis]
MKRLLITGLTGTLAPIVADYFESQGWEVIGWDHHSISPDDESASRTFISEANPDAVCHLAMGSEEWAGWLANWAKENQRPYLFTSTAMVFDAEHNGPYQIKSRREGNDPYGQYKIRCEDAIWQANPDAMIARLGWQIGDKRGGNNMLEFLHAMMDEHGKIDASSAWLPATSHMKHTAEVLFQLIEKNEAGLYHVDSNAQTGWNFAQLVKALAKYHNQPWVVSENQDYKHDQRLLDKRIQTRPLTDWLIP